MNTALLITLQRSSTNMAVLFAIFLVFWRNESNSKAIVKHKVVLSTLLLLCFVIAF